MERKIARFNERLTVQKNAATVDKYGNHKNAWTGYFSCYTYASTYQYDKEETASTTKEEQTVNFEVRWCSELSTLDSTHFRIVFKDCVYDILSVDFMNYQKRTIRIVCKLQKRGGAA